MGDEWAPDWCIAPSLLLAEWMEDNNVNVNQLAIRCTGNGNSLVGTIAGDIIARRLILEVLNKKPLGDNHARTLERGTGIREAMWRSLERDYREGLAAGRIDSS